MAEFETLTTEGMSAPDAYRLLSGAVVPRPIAWITTVDQHGRVNAAPFSAYNFVAHSPPMLAVNIARRPQGLKDTARNILATGEFVVNVVTVDALDAMNASSAEFPPEISEPERLGLALLPGQRVRVPRLAASPVHMECRLEQSVPLGRGINTLYIGEVLAFHLSTAVFDGRYIDTERLKPIARLGGPRYAGLGEILVRTQQHTGAVVQPAVAGVDRS